MRQLVGQIETDRTSQMVTSADAIFTPDLVSRYSRRVGLEGEVNQLEHRLQILARFVRRQLEIEIVAIDGGKWYVQPAFRFFDLDFRLAYRVEILIKALLVMCG